MHAAGAPSCCAAFLRSSGWNVPAADTICASSPSSQSPRRSTASSITYAAPQLTLRYRQPRIVGSGLFGDARDGGGVEWDRPGDEWVWCGPAGLGWERSGTAGVGWRRGVGYPHPTGWTPPVPRAILGIGESKFLPGMMKMFRRMSPGQHELLGPLPGVSSVGPRVRSRHCSAVATSPPLNSSNRISSNSRLSFGTFVQANILLERPSEAEATLDEAIALVGKR